MSKIKITPDVRLLKACLNYDTNTGQLTWRFREHWTFDTDIKHPKRFIASWNAKHCGNPAFITDTYDGYMCGRFNGIHYLAHRIIWKISTGRDPLHIDHINGDRADNRLINLRSIHPSENAKNLAVSSRNTSGVMGVFWHRTNKRWNANINNGKKLVHLGTFGSKEEAVEARTKASVKYGYHANHGRLPV